MACWALPRWSPHYLSSFPSPEALSTCSSYLLLVSTAPCGTTGLRSTSSCPHFADPSDITSSVKPTPPTPKGYPGGNCLSSDNTPLLVLIASGAPPEQGSGPFLSSPPFATESPTQCFLNVFLVQVECPVKENPDRKKAGVRKRRVRAQESELCEGINAVGAKLQKCRKRMH